MRIRAKYWFVPALAILGVAAAGVHFVRKPKPRDEVLLLDPKEPPPPPLPALVPVPKSPTATATATATALATETKN